MCDKRNDSDREHVPALLNRREVLKAGAAAIMSFFGGANSIAQAEGAYGSAGGLLRQVCPLGVPPGAFGSASPIFGYRRLVANATRTTIKM